VNHWIRKGIAAAGVWSASCLVPVLAFAQHVAEHEGAAEHATEAAHESPNLFSVDPGLMIWTIVTFLIVLIVLRVTAWKPLVASLAERERNISGAIADAQRIKSEAEALLAKYETMLDRAKDEARSILDEARKDGVAVQEEIRAKATQEAEEFKARAHKEIDLAKDSALKEIWDLAGSLSTELATRVLGRTLNSDDQQRLVRELIHDMRNETPSGSGSGTGGV
jgi:F-type H+-transporting ATPase subunit b